MNKFQYICLVLITTILMGIAFPIGKIGLSYAPPFFLMGIRYILAGGLQALMVRKKPLPYGYKQWLQVSYRIVTVYMCHGMCVLQHELDYFQ
jgi:drug/metabolite transporter (DMT)-like permease